MKPLKLFNHARDLNRGHPFAFFISAITLRWIPALTSHFVMGSFPFLLSNYFNFAFAEQSLEEGGVSAYNWFSNLFKREVATAVWTDIVATLRENIHTLYQPVGTIFSLLPHFRFYQILTKWNFLKINQVISPRKLLQKS